MSSGGTYSDMPNKNILPLPPNRVLSTAETKNAAIVFPLPCTSLYRSAYLKKRKILHGVIRKYTQSIEYYGAELIHL
jgi:hypothetical protein